VKSEMKVSDLTELESLRFNLQFQKQCNSGNTCVLWETVSFVVKYGIAVLKNMLHPHPWRTRNIYVESRLIFGGIDEERYLPIDLLGLRGQRLTEDEDYGDLRGHSY
jgi:hypothetical protein